MNATPDTAAIVKLAAEKSQKARQRVLEAIGALQKRGEQVNFSTVCREAQVSKTFLYDPKHADLAERIRRLREVRPGPATEAPPVKKSESAKDAQIARLRERNAELERRVRELELENERLYGKLADRTAK